MYACMARVLGEVIIRDYERGANLYLLGLRLFMLYIF